MRISFFVSRCTPDNSHGRYVIELTKRLAREHAITVNAGAFWPPLRSVAHWNFLPTPNRPTIARLAALWATSVVAVRRQVADIVHVQGADAPVANVVTAQFCNAVMRRVADRDQGLYRKFNYAVGAAAEKYCLSKPSTLRIIAISRQVKGDIEREYGVDPRRIVVIPHGVDGVTFHPSRRVRSRIPVRERLGLGRNDFAILFVGGDYRRKGLVPLLEASRRVPGVVKVIAVGVQPDSALARLVQHNGLSNSVKFLDNTTEMAPLYAAADCFALPTRYDTFSMATLEAMGSGLPVIVSRAAGVSELLTSNRDGLILEDPNDVEVLAQQLRNLIEDEVLRSGLGVEARKTAERYSWEDVATRTVAVYRETLACSL